jgi:large subunit ribosomal protein L6
MVFGPWWLTPFYQALYLQGRGLRLRGKSFRWGRRGGTLLLRLGYSHAVAAFAPLGTSIGRFQKTFLHVWGTSAAVLCAFAHSLVGLREPNIYHGRGIRLCKYALHRKFGKVSAYR